MNTAQNFCMLSFPDAAYFFLGYVHFVWATWCVSFYGSCRYHIRHWWLSLGFFLCAPMFFGTWTFLCIRLKYLCTSVYVTDELHKQWTLRRAIILHNLCWNMCACALKWLVDYYVVLHYSTRLILRLHIKPFRDSITLISTFLTTATTAAAAAIPYSLLVWMSYPLLLYCRDVSPWPWLWA